MSVGQKAQQFIEFVLAHKALQIGQFKLKSGRSSPYFFNLGQLNSGASLHSLGRFYAQRIIEQKLSPDSIFGPAYKGIPLAVATAMCLQQEHGVAMHFSANRKEKKQHGEQGGILGAALAGRIVVVDDVLTAGTAARETLDLIQQAGAKTIAVMIAFDRKEQGQGQRSAAQEIEQEYGVDVISIATVDDLCDYLQRTQRHAELEHIRAHQEKYRA